MRVYAGSLKVGQTIRVFGSGDYSLRPGDGFNSSDVLFLFLKHDQSPLPFGVPADPMAFVPLPSGIKIVVHGKVCGFSQLSNPGLYSLITPDYSFGRPFPRVGEFRAALQADIVRASEWHAKLDGPARPDDIPGLLKLLKQRLPSSGFGGDTDVIAGRAAAQLVALRDFPSLEQAILIDNRWASVFGSGFSSPEGREVLLRRMADPSLTHAHRLSLAYAIGAAGCAYQSRTRVAATQPSDVGENNGWYIRRVAELAAATPPADEDVTRALLRALEDQARWGSQSRPAAFQQDLDGAVAVLQKLYRLPATSGAVRYRIDKFGVAVGPEAYRRLGSKCGPVLMLASPADLRMYAMPSTPTIVLNYDYQWQPDSSGATAINLVLESLESRKSVVLPSTILSHIIPGSSGGGGDWVALPPNFPSGRYRVFYRLLNGNQVLGESHGFETALPQVVPAQPTVGLWAPRPSAPWHRWVRTGLTTALTLTALFLAGRLVLRRGQRRARFRAGRCITCGYDLRASRERCPECGTVVPKALPRGELRRKIARATAAGAAMVCLLSAIWWVRSYHVADYVGRSTIEREDSLRFERGNAVLQLGARGCKAGWFWEREAPSQADVADVIGAAEWHLLGVHYAGDGSVAVIPLWLPMFVGAALSLFCSPKWRQSLRAPWPRT